MFVPVMTKCGHNFCYGCITSWLLSNDGGATCPSCREEIIEAPYLNIQIQSMCNHLVDSMKPLIETDIPESITTDRENKIKEYKWDLKRKRLFKNIFKNSGRALVDKSDAVARCSNCHWEVHGNYCENCNTRLRNPNRIQEEFLDSDEEEHIARYDIGNDDLVDDEVDSDPQPNSDDEDFIDDRPIRNLDIYDENSNLSSGESSPVTTRFSDDSDEESMNFDARSIRTGRRIIPDSDEQDSEMDVYGSWNGFHSSSSSRGSVDHQTQFSSATPYSSDEDRYYSDPEQQSDGNLRYDDSEEEEEEENIIIGDDQEQYGDAYDGQYNSDEYY